MKRVAATAVGVVVLLGGAGVAGSAAPRAQLREFTCQTAVDPPARAVSVRAVMRPLPGTRRLAMRFELLSRGPGSRVQLVSGGDLGRWISPANPTLGQRPGDQWIVDKAVVDLPAPAAYRFRVSFRWTGAHHRVLAEVTRATRVCRQPELRPDLIVRRITVFSTQRPGVDAYVAVVANAGATDAGPFAVALTGPAAKSHTLSGLAAHSAVRVRFTAPACSAANPVTITADPGQRVDDRDRSNNSATTTCATVQPAARD